VGKGKGRRISRIRVFANLRASKFGMLVAINSPHSAKKHNFTRNSQSGSFNVMHFGITVKPMTAAYRHIITLASSLKYPKNSQRKRCNLPFSTTPLSFDTPPRGKFKGKFAITRSQFPRTQRGRKPQICRWNCHPICRSSSGITISGFGGHIAISGCRSML